jgi:hypothetical protein
MSDRTPIVAADFAVPAGLSTDRFVLEPLGPQHNAADYAAWTGSIAHIQATAGFAGHDWPVEGEMTLEDNLADMHMHATDFAERVGFTYTVLSVPERDVIGCLYLYPPKSEGTDVAVRSWVIADNADLDAVLYRTVLAWIASEWPFTSPEYAERAAS